MVGAEISVTVEQILSTAVTAFDTANDDDCNTISVSLTIAALVTAAFPIKHDIVVLAFGKDSA